MTYSQVLMTSAAFAFVAGFIFGMFLGVMTWATLFFGR